MRLRYAAKNRGVGSFGRLSMGVRHGAEIRGAGSFEKPPLCEPLPLRNSGFWAVTHGDPHNCRYATEKKGGGGLVSFCRPLDPPARLLPT